MAATPTTFAPTVANTVTLGVLAADDMVWIPGGEFSMGLWIGEVSWLGLLLAPALGITTRAVRVSRAIA